jgi:peptide chain release factor 2
VEEFDAVENKLKDIDLLMEIAEMENDDSVEAIVNNDIGNFEELVSELEFKKMLSDKDDDNDAILTINSGAGGTESQDWAEMLLRMYLRYCEKQGYKANLVDRLDG